MTGAASNIKLVKETSYGISQKNALKFLSEAEESFNKKDYNMTMFFIEQLFQLSLKYIIYKKYGEFPKTHSLKLLFEIIKIKDENPY